jgi:mono/diheme cytochrome c family protein
LAFLHRLWNGGFCVTTSIRYSSLFVLLAFGAACGGGDAPATEDAAPAAEAPAAEAPAAMDMDLPEGVTAAMVAEGEAIFGGQGICFTCHMAGGVGGPLAPNLTDDEWLNVDGSYESIVQNIMTGVPEPIEHPGIMLPKGGAAITDEQVRAVAAYVWTLSNGG